MVARIGALARTRSFPWLAVAVAGIGFQVAHAVEHLAQLSYWAFHPADPPWLTPWAEAGRDILAFGGDPGTGAELLHLLGNGIFFVGLVGLWRYVALSGGDPRGRRPLRAALALQSFHLVEHALLTASSVLTGKAVGFSTLFGALGGPMLFSFRIWWHLLMNLAPTILALQALSRGSRIDLRT